jgi:NTE family protein
MDGTTARLIDALPRPVGFVFGGGGSYGAAQVGMLQALADVGVQPGLVAGTSIGAINGGVVAADPIGAASRLAHLWGTLDRRELLPGGLFARLKTLITAKTHIYESPGITELVRREIGSPDIDDLPIPYAAMALDVDTGLSVRLTSGPLASAMLASSAIPGIFPPVERGGRTLYDGGLVTNVPVLEALDMGAASLVVCDCAFPDQTLPAPTSMPRTIFYAMLVQMRQQALRDMPLAAETVPVIYLPGADPMMTSPLDFSTGHTQVLMKSAYDRARGFLETVEIAGPGLYRSAVPVR